MELNLFFVQEKVLARQLQVVHIPSEDQPADILTKALPSTLFLCSVISCTLHSQLPMQVMPLISLPHWLLSGVRMKVQGVLDSGGMLEQLDASLDN